GHLYDRHPFPTRRSSDLTARIPGRSASARSSRSGSSVQVSAVASTKTGCAPTYRIGLALAEKVSEEQATSSPVPTPSTTSARWRSEEHTSELQSRFDLVC